MHKHNNVMMTPKHSTTSTGLCALHAPDVLAFE